MQNPQKGLCPGCQTLDFLPGVSPADWSMKFLLSLLAYSVALLILPLYVSFIFEYFKNRRWWPAIKHAALALALIIVVFALGWYGLTPSTAASAKPLPDLQNLDKSNFEAEVTVLKQAKALRDANMDSALHIIRVKLEEALYAEKKKDFDRALQLYSEIVRGADENGNFATFPSASVLNNTAVSYFSKQGDKGFRASSLLFEALKTEPKPQHTTDVIRRNIDALDDYINR